MAPRVSQLQGRQRVRLSVPCARCPPEGQLQCQVGPGLWAPRAGPACGVSRRLHALGSLLERPGSEMTTCTGCPGAVWLLPGAARDLPHWGLLKQPLHRCPTQGVWPGGPGRYGGPGGPHVGVVARPPTSLLGGLPHLLAPGQNQPLPSTWLLDNFFQVLASLENMRKIKKELPA